MNRRLPILLVLLLASGFVAAAQREAPAPKPRINRNPAFRESLPPGPTLPPDVRDTTVPAPGPDDPRDSSTRPVLPPGSRDDRDVVVPTPGTTPQPNLRRP
ncbi:hypothetical protein [Polaromonas sp. SM01]|uniref:hypothetical protein n=1 Tax=Polaromonas sp. SM01 TaxID=3085630 RepID=UPI0029812120|nr:hypothetical protein [Polaromonas sp. SM01]MDW5441263.1 hypothetical protein [Polaromonas sp. SM01]